MIDLSPKDNSVTKTRLMFDSYALVTSEQVCASITRVMDKTTIYKTLIGPSSSCCALVMMKCTTIY